MENIENLPPSLSKELAGIKRINMQQWKYWALLFVELKTQSDAEKMPDNEGFYSMSVERIAEGIERIGDMPGKSELLADFSALLRA